MKQFEVGKRYTTHHLKDPNKTLTMTVFFRSEKSIVIGTSLLDNSQRRLRYSESSDSEYVNAPKGYVPFEALNETRETMEEKLWDLLDELDVTCSEEYYGSPVLSNHAIAERIIAKGWTLPVKCESCVNNGCCSIQEAMGESGYCSKGKPKDG